MIGIRPCGSCVTAEIADDESVDLRYIARPGAKVAHLERPRSSEGHGGWVRAMVFSGRQQPHTYCGLPIYWESDVWQYVEL
jgi:hypothetical protein